MNKTRLCIRLIGIIVIIESFFLFFNKANAQVSFLGGANYCYVRNNHLLENQEPVFAHHLGVAVRLYPFKNLPNLSVQNELLFNRKGYKQFLDQKYLYQFNYISFPILLFYSPVKYFSLNGGVEISGLLYTNLKKGTETYNNKDAGIVLGFSCFDNQMLSIYSRVTYGLVPMLDYYSFDKLGNFTGKIHDLKNISLSIGIKLNFYNEQIHLHK